ncbi:hypothetical protein J6590_053954 [Homalodisca vitripennis]|nr:hypothetical protein J6590_053954 [Homalodisca vitripennis]
MQQARPPVTTTVAPTQLSITVTPPQSLLQQQVPGPRPEARTNVNISNIIGENAPKRQA